MAKAGIPVDVLRSTRYDPICIKTGRPHERWIKADFYYTPPWVALLLLGGILPFVIVAMIVRKQVTVYLPAVNKVQTNKRLMMAAVLVSLFGGIVMLVVAVVKASGGWAAAGAISIVASIFLGFWGMQRAWIRGTLSSDETTIKVSGAHPAFVAATTSQAHPPAGPGAAEIAAKPGLQNLSYVREGQAVATAPVTSDAPPPPPGVSPTTYESGGGAGSPVPPDLGSWNWGGFLLTWIWAIGNRVWVGLLALVPIPALWIAMAIVLGVKGNEWAWQKKRWQNVEHFKRVQRKWTIAGIIVWLLLIAGITIALIAAKPWETAEVANGSFVPESEGTEVIPGEDENFTVTVPTSWFPDERLNKRADLGVGSPFEEMYAIVFLERANRIPKNFSLERYSAITRGPILNKLSSASEKKVGTRIIDGYEALEYELRGTVDDLDLVYIHTVLRTEEHFVQILAWTLEPRFDRNSETLRAVINSFDAQ
ncbi:MAG: hypothetical protein KY391_04570 [Actinobacteria bacterium]|nr:hypothetical protein [Actinomycetota bacterium]